MDCAAAMTATSPALAPGQGADCASARHFQAALNAPDVYVDGPARASNETGNPLVAMLSRFEALDLRPPMASPTASDQTPDTFDQAEAEPVSDVDRFSAFGQEVMATQAEILRTVLMMETVNVAKQGVTTLFQQQG